MNKKEIALQLLGKRGISIPSPYVEEAEPIETVVNRHVQAALTGVVSSLVKAIFETYRPKDGEAGANGTNGENGITPIAGIDYPTHEQVVEFIQANLVTPKNGIDGVTPEKGIDYFTPEEVTALKSEIMAAFPTYEKPEPFSLDEKMVKEIVNIMRRLPEKDRLEIQDIRNANQFMYKGTKYDIAEMMHGAGSSSGGGFTVISVSGVIDDSNLVFTAATQPTLLNINGGFYQQTGGSITWTYAGDTITLSSPVGTNGSIYGIA